MPPPDQWHALPQSRYMNTALFTQKQHKYELIISNKLQERFKFTDIFNKIVIVIIRQLKDAKWSYKVGHSRTSGNWDLCDSSARFRSKPA